MPTFVCLLVLPLAGCLPDNGADPAPSGSQDLSAAQRRIDELQAEVVRLTAQVRVLELGREELTAREKRLSAEARHLRFLNDQKDKQIKALADAPKERDLQRARADALRKENLRLQREIQQLKQRIDRLSAPVSATTTAAAS